MEQVKSIFSFTRGFLTSFGATARRVDEIANEIATKTDEEALKGDWYNVGKDIKKSLSNYENSKKLEVDACQ